MKSTIEDFIASHPSFTTKEFTNTVYIEAPNTGRSTIYHMLKLLCESGKIIRIQRGLFSIAQKKDYSYDLSDRAKEISSTIQKQYPLVDFQVWELYQMNEFVNHQLAKNVIFVEVESMLDESIFNLFFKKYPHVLFSPNEDEYYKYSGNETIIIEKLISEAPPCFGKDKQASLEKILVDIFGRSISGRIISRSEYPSIYEDSFNKYNINQAKMFRYARRRGIDQKIKKYICEETTVRLRELK